MLIAWSAIAPTNGAFKRDENRAYIDGNEIKNSIEAAILFYMVKKDKNLQHLIKSHLLKFKNLDSVAKEIKEIAFSKNNFKIELDDKIYLPREGIKKVWIDIFNLEAKKFEDSFKSEVFRGVIDLKIDFSDENLIKNALLSFSRSFSEHLHKSLKDTPLEEAIINIQNQIANEWENSLILGKISKSEIKKEFLFFYKIKEVRDRILKDLKYDILPKDIFYISGSKELLGWCELKI
jgi:hypothetical protein